MKIMQENLSKDAAKGIDSRVRGEFTVIFGPIPLQTTGAIDSDGIIVNGMLIIYRMISYLFVIIVACRCRSSHSLSSGGMFERWHQ